MGVTKSAMFDLAAKLMTKNSKYTKALRRIWATI